MERGTPVRLPVRRLARNAADPVGMVARVAALPDAERYAYLCARFGDWCEVWSLRNAKGWVKVGDNDGREGVPVWPHPRFAEACAVLDRLVSRVPHLAGDYARRRAVGKEAIQ